MSDFTVNIDSTLDLSKAQAQMESFLSKYKNEAIKVGVELNTKGINTGNLGKQIQTTVGNSVKTITFNSDTFYKQYFDQAKKDIKEGQAVQKSFQKDINSINTSNVDKSAMKAVRARVAAENKANREYVKLQQKQSDLYSNPKKEAYQSIGKRTQSIEDLKKYYKEQEKQYAELSKIQKRVQSGSFEYTSARANAFLDKYSGQENNATISRAREQLQEVQKIQKELSETFGSNRSLGELDIIPEDEIAKVKQLDEALDKLNMSMKTIGVESSKSLGVGVAERSANEVKKYINANSKALKQYGVELADLENRYKSITTVAEKADLDNEFKNLKSRISAEGLTGRSPLEELGRGLKQVGQFAWSYGLVQRIPEALSEMVNAVIEVDTAMTNLYKVTDETDAKYTEFLNNAGNTAKSLGRDVSSYIEQTANWAKLGYTMDQSAELAKVSSIYANVGEVDDNTAVSDLVTVMKAYNMKDSQAINIVDMLNELGNNYATDSASLGDGLKNMASTMAMSNTSLEKSLAILTGGAEITQNAGELGNAIKVAVLRMHGQKGALEDIGEYADDVESVSKMQTQILNMTKGAVNIMDSADPTSFRDYYDVMADIAEVLPTLDGTTQADLIETLFGKNRANQGQAILQAFQSGQIQKAYETALNSEGSAQKEQDRWLESAEAKLQQFQAQFQELSTTTINSDLFKGLIDGGIGLLNLLTQIIDTAGMLPLLLGGAGITAFLKNLDHQKVLKNCLDF